jgi:hypothetical protein
MGTWGFTAARASYSALRSIRVAATM